MRLNRELVAYARYWREQELKRVARQDAFRRLVWVADSKPKDGA